MSQKIWTYSQSITRHIESRWEDIEETERKQLKDDFIDDGLDRERNMNIKMDKHYFSSQHFVYRNLQCFAGVSELSRLSLSGYLWSAGLMSLRDKKYSRLCFNSGLLSKYCTWISMLFICQYGWQSQSKNFLSILVLISIKFKVKKRMVLLNSGWFL